MKNIAATYIGEDGIPRCGCPDFSLSSGKRSWKHKNLTYCILQRDADLPQEVWDLLIWEAFDSWSNVSDLSFEKIEESSQANILIDIGHGAEHHFDGPSGTLAWAYLPPRENYSGQLLMKFDTAELWSDGHESGMLLKNVAAHEIGHILGLAHSEKEAALMAPYYNKNIFEPQQEDDITRIQEIYGKPNN
tara:strand:+ start:660 stop:1229 length:570 start_codon:yes stop_codon:yes gene_type:complete